jgi:hypothetical protein
VQNLPDAGCTSSTLHPASASQSAASSRAAQRHDNGDHTVAAKVSILRAVFNEYEISQKFHFYVGDNATSKNAKLIKGLNLHANVKIDPQHRIRCAGHIFNETPQQAIKWGSKSSD